VGGWSSSSYKQNLKTKVRGAVMSIWVKIKSWYKEDIIVVQHTDPSIFCVKPIDQSTLSAQFARKLVAFCCKHWQWLIGTSVVVILGVAGLYLSYLALTKDRLIKEKSREPGRTYQEYKI
jgi:hypothetical protein